MDSFTPILTKGEIRQAPGTAGRQRSAAPLVKGSAPTPVTAALDAPLILFAVDCAGLFTLLEGKGAEQDDILPDANLGKSAFELEADLPGLSDLVARALAGESSILASQTNRRTLDVWSTPVREPNGSITGMVGVVIDTSKRRDLEREVHHQERLAILGQLAGGIAHDFNNFLTTIMLYARLILNSEQISSDLRSAAETIVLESRRASDLIDQILRFSRRSPMKMQPIDLTWLVRNITRMLKTTLPDNVSLVTEFGREGIAANADPTGIQQLIMNLAINARDAMPEGGTLRIALTLHCFGSDQDCPLPDIPPGDWICLMVSDTGSGMTREVLDRLYEPFFTTKGAGGTGLGLAQVHRIVQQHQGYIQVQSKVGEGTTFRIYIPSFDPESADSASSSR